MDFCFSSKLESSVNFYLLTSPPEIRDVWYLQRGNVKRKEEYKRCLFLGENNGFMLIPKDNRDNFHIIHFYRLRTYERERYVMEKWR